MLNKFGQLMTLDQHRDGCMLHIFAQEGTLIQSYPFFPVDGPVRSERSKCRFMAVNDHFLIVSDLGKGGSFNQMSNLLKCFSSLR